MIYSFIFGRKCSKCGTVNNMMRATCTNCGAKL